MRGFDKLNLLTQLNLDDNRIFKITGLESLVNLRKLTLEKNCISRLEGLTGCRKLEELYLGKQTLPPEVEFSFDEYSLATLSVNILIDNFIVIFENIES